MPVPIASAGAVIAGIVILVIVLVIVIAIVLQLPELRRYMKIRSM